jgi:flagellar motor switch protein FliN/FliY
MPDPEKQLEAEKSGPGPAAAAAAAPIPPVPSAAAPAAAGPLDGPAPAAFPDLARAAGAGHTAGIDLLGDVHLQVRIELGRTRMLVEDVLRLSADSVVELDKAAGDPVDIFVNGRHIARGEVLVLNENFCVRVSELLEPLGGAGVDTLPMPPRAVPTSRVSDVA